MASQTICNSNILDVRFCFAFPCSIYSRQQAKWYSVYWRNKQSGTSYLAASKQRSRWFYSKYSIHQLVWYEIYEEMNEAIKREKQLKKWKRAWKLELIEEMNPEWQDLWEEICI